MVESGNYILELDRFIYLFIINFSTNCRVVIEFQIVIGINLPNDSFNMI